MRKILSFFVFTASFFAFFSFVQAEGCETKKDFGLYTCRVKQICDGSYKPQKPTYKTTNYEEAETLTSTYIGQEAQAPAFEEAKKIYRENIGTIYKCVMIQAQKNALDFLKDQLKEKTGKIDDTIGRQIEQRINKLDLTTSTLKCSLTEKDSFTIKQNLLKETTYEMCKYVSYLTYLKGYYSNTQNVLGVNEQQVNDLYKKEYQVTQIPKLMAGIQGSISAEIKHTYKVFPLVFHAYSEYENNFPIHFMLEVIHADFVLLRQKIYETIMPIAQVGYKIINAMGY